MTDINEWMRALTTCSLLLRKGTVTTQTKEGGIEVITIDVMPHKDQLPHDPDRHIIDMVLCDVAVLKSRAEAARPEIIRLLESQDAALWAGGPSYITIGAALGDQGLAFKLMAVLKVLGMAEVITPMTFGVKGELATKAAGQGYVMLTPMHEPWTRYRKETADAEAQSG